MTGVAAGHGFGAGGSRRRKIGLPFCAGSCELLLEFGYDLRGGVFGQCFAMPVLKTLDSD